MAESGVARSEIFLLQKTGSWNAMGFQDTLTQMDFLLQQMNVSYTDLVLNHWPTSPASPTVDPLCDPKKPTYDEKGCRLSTWRAYVEIWKAGKSLAIGVANYNTSHLQEIIDAGMPLPAVNQVRVLRCSRGEGREQMKSNTMNQLPTRHNSSLRTTFISPTHKLMLRPPPPYTRMIQMLHSNASPPLPCPSPPHRCPGTCTMQPPQPMWSCWPFAGHITLSSSPTPR